MQEQPGVTRDRKELVASWNGRSFLVVDTGGWIATDEPLAKQVSLQAERAIREADVVLHVVDVTVGATEEDAQVARILQRSDTPVLLVANKADDDRREREIWPLAKLGLGDPHPVSAIHGRGSGDLLDALVARPAAGDARARARAGRAAAVLGRDRRPAERRASRRCSTDSSATSAPSCTTCPARPGTRSTRSWRPRRRRCGSSTPRGCGAGAVSTRPRSTTRCCARSTRSIVADAALLVIDATEGVSHQDQRLARAHRRRRHRDRRRAQQVGPRRRPRTASRSRSTSPTASASSATRRCCRSRRSPAATSGTCCRR